MRFVSQTTLPPVPAPMNVLPCGPEASRDCMGRGRVICSTKVHSGSTRKETTYSEREPSGNCSLITMS